MDTWINMANFTPYTALLGGILIGSSALIMMVMLGRISGISGIAAGLLTKSDNRKWQLPFLVGLIIAPLIAPLITGEAVEVSEVASIPILILAGLLVGFGTRLGGGCTSGHGICGISRLSMRSVVAVITFIATAIATLYILRHLVGA